MEDSAISWTDHTHNAWWGCVHAPADDPAGPLLVPTEPGEATGDPEFVAPETSPECDHCYAEVTDHRYGGGHWGATAPRRVLSDDYWRKPLTWNRRAMNEGKRARVFCSSMADVFETHADPETQAVLDTQRVRLWRLILETPWLDWLLLTKRPQNFARYLPWLGMLWSGGGKLVPGVPWPNVWLGVSIGVRRSLWRARYLRETPAVLRFISGEPLLEHISGHEWDSVLGERRMPHDRTGSATRAIFGDDIVDADRVHWLIIGDESGHGRRPCQADWVRTAREAAARHGVAFHFKQWNGPTTGGIGRGDGRENHKNNKIHLPILDGRKHAAIPEFIPLGERDP